MSLLVTLSENSFFRSIPLEILRLIEPIASERSFAPSDQIFVEGERHPEIYVVLHGHVRLEMLIPARGKIPILSAGAGDVLGWSPLLGESVMTATAVALDPVQVLVFPADPLRGLCESNHDVGFHFMRQLASAIAQRLMATRLQLLDLYKVHDTDRTLSAFKPGDDQC